MDCFPGNKNIREFKEIRIIYSSVIIALQMIINIFKDFRGKKESIFYTLTYYCHNIIL